MGMVTLSAKELDRVEILGRVVDKRLTQRRAAELLGVTDRQVRRLLGAYVDGGAAALVSKRRGKPSNRKLPVDVRSRALAIVRDRYADFGPTLAREKLEEAHGLRLAVETLRQWMTEDGLWIPRALRAARAYQPRYRRSCVGELVQIDGSDHAWFEDRAPACTLLVFVDDATSELREILFVETESAFDYFAALRRYLERYGKPVALYSDRHSVFHVNKKDLPTGDGVTQFGRACHELNIEIICANSSQAKGRVERAHQTLQDRLVKELRLREISSLEGGNRYLPAFRADYNRRFGKPPQSTHDAHRPLRLEDDLDQIFTWQEERKLTNDLVVNYKRVMYLVEDTVETRKLRGRQIRVHEREDGTVTLNHGGLTLPYGKFEKDQRVSQGAIVDNKHLGAALAFAQRMQQERDEKLLASRALTKREKKRIPRAAGDSEPAEPVFTMPASGG